MVTRKNIHQRDGRRITMKRLAKEYPSGSQLEHSAASQTTPSTETSGICFHQDVTARDTVSGVTENIRAPLQTQVLGLNPKYALCVSQALSPLESLGPPPQCRDVRYAAGYSPIRGSLIIPEIDGEAAPQLHSTYINNKQSTIPPAHHWYEAKRPGGSLSHQYSRCSACQASPEHILDCLELSKQDIYEDPLMTLDFLRVNEIMDLV
ncbi:RNase H domain-containing protein [Trichonephila clavipes]|nr:RNase H domain-containing protein [Trichonephila clavipes]